MAFHNHIISHEMVFQEPNFAEQPLSLSASDNDDAGVGAGAGAPTWLNNSVFRQHNLLHLLSESEPQNDDVLAGKRGGDCGDRRSDRRREGGFGDEEEDDDEEVEDGESEGLRYKADILRHPLYEQLLSAHVSCLRIATPVDQLPRIDEQLSQSQIVVSKYSELGTGGGIQVVDEKELDQFMVCFLILKILFPFCFQVSVCWC